MSKPGRPKGRTKKPVSLRLSKEALKALDHGTERLGWTKVRTVEKALVFASRHPDFGKPEVAV